MARWSWQATRPCPALLRELAQCNTAPVAAGGRHWPSAGAKAGSRAVVYGPRRKGAMPCAAIPVLSPGVLRLGPVPQKRHMVFGGAPEGVRFGVEAVLQLQYVLWRNPGNVRNANTVLQGAIKVVCKTWAGGACHHLEWEDGHSVPTQVSIRTAETSGQLACSRQARSRAWLDSLQPRGASQSYALSGRA